MLAVWCPAGAAASAVLAVAIAASRATTSRQDRGRVRTDGLLGSGYDRRLMRQPVPAILLRKRACRGGHGPPPLAVPHPDRAPSIISPQPAGEVLWLHRSLPSF